MTAMLIDKASIFSLSGYMIPLLVFAALAIALLVYTSKRVALKGKSNMKKICSVFAALLLLTCCAVPALAVSAPATQDIGVEITSPSGIEGKPVYKH